MFDAVIFDMDGVLVDSETIHFETTNAVLAARGARLERPAYDTYLGMDEEAFFGRLAERFGLSESPTRLARERVALSVERLARDPLPPLPGVMELMLALRGEGRAMAVASSATHHQVQLVLERLGVGRLMAAVVSKDDVPRGKPAPDIYLEAARRLETDPARCLAIEDAALGVLAARTAGMTVLALVADPAAAQPHRDAGAADCRTSLAGLSVDDLDHLAMPR